MAIQIFSDVQINPKVLTVHGDPLSHTGTTGEVIVLTVTIPAGMVPAGSVAHIVHAWSSVGAGTWKPRIRLGGLAGTEYYAPAAIAAAIDSICGFTSIIFPTINTQIGSQAAANETGFGASNTPVPTSSVNMAAATTLVFTAQLTSAADTITLTSAVVSLFTPVA